MQNYNIDDRVMFIYNNNQLLEGTIIRIDGIFKNKIKVKTITGFFKTSVVIIRKKDIIKIKNNIEEK